MVSSELVEFFTAKGYVVVRQLIDSKTLDALRKALLYIVGGHEEGIRRKLPVQFSDGTKVTEFQGLWKTSPEPRDDTILTNLKCRHQCVVVDAHALRPMHVVQQQLEDIRAPYRDRRS